VPVGGPPLPRSVAAAGGGPCGGPLPGAHGARSL